MTIEEIVTHEGETEFVATFDIAPGIQVITAHHARVMTVFFGEEEFEARINRHTADILDKMCDAKDFEAQVFFTQVLKIFSRILEEGAAI